MGITLAFKQLLCIGCCLLVPSGLAAHPPASQPREPGEAQAAQVGDAQLPIFFTKEQLDDLFNGIRYQPRPMPEEQRAALEWVRWLLYAIVAAGAGWGGWRMAHSPKPRVDRLGLGAHGKGGVWLREVLPWEK
jgi:hypothetical protein